jgi:lipopolysaccharide transport system ATP-binding protein
MFPHTGSVHTEGQVGALIEVMSGIHSELTGRENISIYGNLLGLGRKQVAEKFDEIVAFAEIEDAIDRQVKFYSSGMKVRLGFAVAAFLEPKILIVDEVLAVGDSSFQQKCLERIRHVIQSGTTLLLVSHDLASVGAAATRGIWIADGTVQMDGPIDQTLAGYRRMIEAQAEANADVKGSVRVAEVRVEGNDGRLVVGTEDCTIHLSVETDEERTVRLYLGVSEGAATPIFVVANATTIEEGRTDLAISLDHLPLPPRQYYLWFGAYDLHSKAELTAWQPIKPMLVSGRLRLDPVPRAIVRLSPVYVAARWSKVR